MVFGRRDWAALRSNTPLTVSDEDLESLRGLNEPMLLDEVTDIHLPLSRLLNLHVAAARNLRRVKDAFLGRLAGRPPYIIAVAGAPSTCRVGSARLRSPEDVSGTHATQCRRFLPKCGIFGSWKLCARRQ